MKHIDKLISEFTVEIAKLETAVKLLRELRGDKPGANKPKPSKRGRHNWTEAQKKAMSRIAKASWRKRKAAQKGRS